MSALPQKRTLVEELTRFFGGLDHTKRQAVLDRAERVEGLDLDEQVDAHGRELVDPNNRRVAHRL